MMRKNIENENLWHHHEKNVIRSKMVLVGKPNLSVDCEHRYEKGTILEI